MFSSAIAVANADGKVDVIANPDGDRAIPSILSYVGVDEYHGAQAKAQLIRNPTNTIINFRDYIGKKYDEVDISASKLGAPAIQTEDGNIAYKIIREENKTEIVTVGEAVRRHLIQLKLAAEDYLGNDISEAVITVPTDFNEHQRTELVKFAGEAGLKVLQLVNEPSAALLAHLSATENKLLEDKTYVVADFGGIRSDAAVISVRGGILTELATAHEPHLGGDNLDDSLVEYFAKEFEKKFKVDPRKTARSLAKLKAESINVKRTLSNVQTSTCSIESLAEGFDFHTSINRLRYELTARSVFGKMTSFVEQVIKKAGLDPLDIDEVVLVGGTSHSPKLASNVSFVFPESTVVVAPTLDPKALDPSELICRGAALQASLIESFDEEEIKESLQPIVVNTQHLKKPIGIKDAEGNFVPILVAETAYPIKKSVNVTNGTNENVIIELYEGKRTIKETIIEPTPVSDAEDLDDDSDEEPEIQREVVYETGDLLAKLSLKDLKPNSELEVIVNITQNGVLHLSGRELKPGSVAVKGEITSA
ncbi:Hsp70 protein that interacts with Zuo1p [Scheffersomyces spartinae]|uniref:Hsp70 protein that interacts with Zuo1p n=1 Tax=Scheffersomyces spartinae TaxID=45513 RepID=A0A9P7V5G4_9ASCO|nr:Hsp70 protein that interacts with Zuo1p [Scheffersomyces spartinae]KAG7191314.1 Hsp70 protein that interacts with Zuo1p [Scheffersomyces spartinae]